MILTEFSHVLDFLKLTASKMQRSLFFVAQSVGGLIIDHRMTGIHINTYSKKCVVCIVGSVGHMFRIVKNLINYDFHSI